MMFFRPQLQAFAWVALGVCSGIAAGVSYAQTTQQNPAGKISNDNGGSGNIAQGKKLVLKDGNFQLVREYQRTGERVKYFSTERADWEEIPAAMVDWEATAKASEARGKMSLRWSAHERQMKTPSPVSVR